MAARFESVGSLVRGQETFSLGPEASVQEAAELMARHRVGSILVVQSGQLRGLFTERDLLNRVVAKGLRPESVSLEDVMTKDPVTVESKASLVQSLTTMFEQKFRHLPVLENGRVVGVLSCRDIPAGYWILQENWVAAQADLKVRTG